VGLRLGTRRRLLHRGGGLEVDADTTPDSNTGSPSPLGIWVSCPTRCSMNCRWRWAVVHAPCTSRLLVSSYVVCGAGLLGNE